MPKLYFLLVINLNRESFLMLIVKPEVEKKDYGIGKDMLRVIEYAGRVCYQSFPKDEKDTILPMIMEKGHTSILEHGNIVFLTNMKYFNYISYMAKHSTVYPYIKSTVDNDRVVISGNARAWYTLFDEVIDYDSDEEISIEIAIILELLANNYPVLYGGFLDKISKRYKKIGSNGEIVLLKNYDALSIEEAMMHIRITIGVLTDRGITHEIVRHRKMSFSQESTRYCNYSKDRFGKQITFIEPSFWTPVKFEVPENITDFQKRSILDNEEKINSFREAMYDNWIVAMRHSEDSYLNMIEKGATPQEARTVLPNSLASRIVITGSFEDWDDFRKLRTGSNAHPQMREIASEISKIVNSEAITQFEKRKL